jgi:Na+-transporting NADH:ubiquinone oxidoreductase subunit F
MLLLDVDVFTVGISIVVFLIIILMLVSILLYAKAKLLPSGEVTVNINQENDLVVEPGSTLLTTLGNNKILLPSACGGGGTCAMCTLPGARRWRGEILPN